MTHLTPQLEQLLVQRFGHDCIVALATTEEGHPYVRQVDAYYEDGAFYIVTYSGSNKVRQIGQQPLVALAGEWFTAHGLAEDLGWMGLEQNQTLSQKLREVFATWLDNGHTDPKDPTTHILRVHLTDGLLLSHGTRYEFTLPAPKNDGGKPAD